MENTIIIGIAIALIFFVWVWIGLTIVQRLSLEQKIEKLENIENRLPEEQRTLNHLTELRAIERNKVGSAKLILGFFGVLLLVALGLATLNERVQGIFGLDSLKDFSLYDIVVLSFIVLPTYVGLTLASGGKPRPSVAGEKAVKEVVS